jgi:hypothetical protein
MSAAVLNEPEDSCAECARLDKQERAAYLAGDASRRSDVRVQRIRHKHDVHGVTAGFVPTLLAGPFRR